jgi:hypothetical protein
LKRKKKFFFEINFKNHNMEISFSKIKSSVIEAGKRILKVEQFGAKTAKEAYPFGFDSVPPEGFTAIFAETTNKDASVIVGYINKNQLAEVGASRMYALGESGEVSGFVYVRASGVLELNGSDFSAVRYENLKAKIYLLQTQINSQWPLIAAGIATGGGTYTPTSVNVDFSNTQSPTVKLK